MEAFAVGLGDQPSSQALADLPQFLMSDLFLMS